LNPREGGGPCLDRCNYDLLVDRDLQSLRDRGDCDEGQNDAKQLSLSLQAAKTCVEVVWN